MTQDKIDRINELARKQRTEEGLTDEERAEQQKLRSEYINSIKRNLPLQPENPVIGEEQGSKRQVTKREKKGGKH